MLQIAAIVVGVLAMGMGVGALLQGEIAVSRSTKLHGGAAKAAAVATIVVGIAVLIFAFVGLPLLI